MFFGILKGRDRFFGTRGGSVVSRGRGQAAGPKTPETGPIEEEEEGPKEEEEEEGATRVVEGTTGTGAGAGATEGASRVSVSPLPSLLCVVSVHVGGGVAQLARVRSVQD